MTDPLAEVRSFAEHWHFISGGMEEQDEGDVVRRCWKELEEEVRLSGISDGILALSEVLV